MTEAWRPIPGLPFHEASTEGRLRSWKNGKWPGRRTVPRILSMKPGKRGYPVVNLGACRGNRPQYVHQLIALTFIGECPEGHEVCHDDADKTNVRPANLYYGTRRQNTDDRLRHGDALRGERHGSAKLTARIVRQIRRSVETQRVLARRHGVSQGLVGMIQRRERWAWLDA